MSTAEARFAPADPGLLQFNGTFQRSEVPLRYRLGLLGAAFAMVSLPLVYLAVVSAAAYLVYLQATQGYLGRGVFGLLVYLTPLVAGSIVVFFMVKPLFARPARAADTVKLSPEDEPTLFALVQEVCALVGAPEPREIRVDCQVNASASFRRGLLSFLGDDLTLTIGLPLVAGIRANQLAGVLAHEFGHFSQGGGMRLSYVVRVISAWFHRVVYERDQWDLKLDRWSRETDWRIAIMLWIAKAGVWLSRKILWGLMWIGHLISTFLLRQMEFDADSYQVRLVGAETFEETFVELQLLGAGLNESMSRVSRYWSEGRLIKDLPGMVSVIRGEITEASVQAVRKSIDLEETGRFDTHPATNLRVAAAKQAGPAAVYACRAPATALFADFEALSRRVTENYFRDHLGLEYDADQALEIDEAAQHTQDAYASEDALDQLTGGLLRYSHAVGAPRPEEESTATLSDALASSAEAQATLEAHKQGWSERIDQFDQAWDRRTTLDQADALLRAGLRLNLRDFEVAASSHQAVDDALRLAQSQIDSASPTADAIQSAVRNRLRALETIVLAADDEPTCEEWLRLTPTLSALADAADPIQKMGRELVALGALVANGSGLQGDTDFITIYKNVANRTATWLGKALGQVDDVTYPFAHAGGELTVREFLVRGTGEHIYDRGREVNQRAVQLYYRVLARMANIGLAAEEAARARD